MAPVRQDISCTVTQETLESYRRLWSAAEGSLPWNCLFTLPPWVDAWWKHFGSGRQLHICSVRSGAELIGAAPLMLRSAEASPAGSPDVCDYFDFAAARGREAQFFTALITHLRAQGVKVFNSGPVRPDSCAAAHLVRIARDLGCRVSSTPDDASFELKLPPSWDRYLLLLDVKQRHEIRRKLKRLDEAGPYMYRAAGPDRLQESVENFLVLFRSARQNKADFMTGQMEAYFRSLAASMAECGMLRLCFLDIRGEPAASVMCFDYSGTTYLYNSGYDGRFSSLSAGLLCKVLSIRHSIERGSRVYDFLKGAEVYKQRLGSAQVQLHRLLIQL